MPNLNDVDDLKLFAQLKQGDEGAFTTIYQKYWRILFDAAYRRLPDRERCQDIIQNVFVDLWRRKTELELQKPLAYLQTAVRFQVLKVLGRENKTSNFYTELEEKFISPFKADQQILDKEAKLILQLFIVALPQKRRKIFMMYYFDGMDIEEIAANLEVSEKTVRNQLSEASKMLKMRITHLFLLFVLLVFLF